MGLTGLTEKQKFLWRMYKYWKKGIPSQVYRKERANDVITISLIDNMVQEKQRSEIRLKKMMSK